MSESQEVRGRLDVTYPPASPGLLCVIICMTIMAVCAVMYFGFRCYFEERSLHHFFCRKCGPVGGILERHQDHHAGIPAEEIATPADPSPCVHSSPVTHYSPDHKRRIRSETTGRYNRYRRRLRSTLNYSDVPVRNVAVTPVRNIPEIIVSSANEHNPITISSNVRQVPAECHSVSTNADTSSSDEEVVQSQEIHTSPFHPRYNTPVSLENEGSPSCEDSVKVNSRQSDAALYPSGARDQPPEGNSETSIEKQTPVLVQKSHPGCYQSNLQTFPTYLMSAVDSSSGKLVTRWTQTEGGSVTSLDWDPYESERLRCIDTGPDELSYEVFVKDINLNETLRATPPYIIYFQQSEEQTEPLDLCLRKSGIASK